jgi:4a-hydroxytetrahydrobiopterin dehydratase
MSPRLTEEEIADRLAPLVGWEPSNNEIRRRFQFADFKAALEFVNAVAVLAEEVNHHPDIDIRWNKVLLRLSTHSKGGLTELDFDLAEKIDALA